MAAKAGVDLFRGRPTPAVGSTEAKLQQRKLDALKRGIHRISDADTLKYSVHMIGLGGEGTRIVEQVLENSPDDLLAVEGSRLSALAIDIGEHDFADIRALASKFPAERTHIETCALATPSPKALFETLNRYRDFLRLEYPMHRWTAERQSWLDPDNALPGAGEQLPRAVAKAVYGRGYYDGERPVAAALKRFAGSVDAGPGDCVVCIIFALGDSTGSGMAVDLARHLSNAILGRRVLVAAIAIAPCDGDQADHAIGPLFPVLNELDCLGDESLNRGVVQSCGDLFKNPFTAGFIMIPQQPVWEATKNLAATHARVDQEIASLLTQRKGASLWEMLRLLNWVAAASTQHSAARTPWGARWIHMLGFADAAGKPIAIGPGLPKQLGLRPSYMPEFIEMRVANAADASVSALAAKLEEVFAPEVAPQVVGGGRTGSVQFILPRISKTDLTWFRTARTAYDAEPSKQKLLDHSLLLDQGVVLSEPSTQLAGMAGASVPGTEGWVAVPLAALRGEGSEGKETSSAA